MARTVLLSWLQERKMWTNVIGTSWPADDLLVAIVMCHGMPHLPNQTRWLSLYFRGKYFIAQSCSNITDSSLKLSFAFSLASSWLTERRRWSLHVTMLCLACSVENVNSLSSSTDVVTRLSASSIFWMVCSRRLQRSHTQSCMWSQFHSLSAAPLASLGTYCLQWSVMDDDSETWTFKFVLFV